MRRALPLLTLLAACTTKAPNDSASAPASATAATTPVASVAHADWTRRATIYEVNVRQFTPEGTLAAARPHLARIKALGADIVWLMPVQPIGVKNRKGSLGSYYSVRDYTAINPEFGTAADFKAYVQEAHAQGLRVILDWVPNHTAFDHAWITAHPDWYVHKPDGSISNARDGENKETDWTDVAELDYTKPAMRSAMIDAMKWWLTEMNIDGFRCDVAGGVPDDFWHDARAALQQTKSDVFMLAEAETPAMHAAFDMTYGWTFHHLLNDVAQGKQSVDAIDAYLAKEQRTYPADAYHMYFTSNHDENSWNGTEFERMGANNVPAFVVAATLEGGMPLLYNGQEVSMKKRLRFFEKDTIDWKGPSVAPFYAAMLALKHAEPALENGSAGGKQTRVLSGSDPKIYAFTRTKDSNTVFVAVNFGDTSVQVGYANLTVPGAYTDWFDKSKVTLGASGTLAIPAHGYRVLVH